MLLPSAMTGFVHYKKGNMMVNLIPALVSGTGKNRKRKDHSNSYYKALSAWVTGLLITSDGNEVTTRIAYCVAMATLAYLTLRPTKKPLRVPAHLVKGIKKKSEPRE